MIRKIALEEHFLNPGLEEYWLPTMAGVDAKVVSGLQARLKDFGDIRLQAMDNAGIARSVLSVSGPGVQNEPDTATARRRAAVQPVTEIKRRKAGKPANDDDHDMHDGLLPYSNVPTPH